MSAQTPGAQRPKVHSTRFAGQVTCVKTAIESRFGPIPRPARVAIGVGLATVLIFGATAGGFGIVTAANAAGHENAMTENHDAAARLGAARALDATTIQKLNSALVAGAALNTKVAGFVAAAPGVVDPTALADLETARAKLATAVTGIATDRSVDLLTGLPAAGAVTRPIVKAPTVKTSSDTRDIVAATLATDTLIDKADGAVKGSTFLITALGTATSAVTKSVTPVVKSVAAAGQARLDGTPSAGAAERDAVATAITAVTDADSDTALDTLIAYTSATTAVKASHDAIEAQKAGDAAAAAAAAQAAAESAPRTSSGGRSSSGRSGGSSSTGGTSSSGGSSSSGGGQSPASGSASGGGDSAPGGGGDSSTGATYSVSVGQNMTCTNAGGTNSSSGGLLLIPGSNVADHWVTGVPGNWTVTWTCNDGSAGW